MKKGRLLLALSLSFGLMLTGCSSDSSSDGNGKDGDKVTLRVGTWEGGDGQAMQQKIADAYMAKHPDVKIVIESVPDQYGTKLLTQIAAGDAPDIFQIGDGDIRTFMEKGALEELTPFVDGKSGIKEEDYYENVLNVGKIDDKLYTMPKDYSTLAVFYNKALFDKAGVDYPKAGWTWDDFYEISKKLTKKDNGKIVQWGVRLGGAEQRFLSPLLYSYGGSVISEDGTEIDGYFNSDGSKKALNLYHDMYFKDKVAPSTSDTEAFKGVDLFSAGKVAMNLMGRWPVNDYKANPDLKFGTVEVPQGPNGKVNSIFYAGYGLYSKSKHKDAAWDYLKYLTGKEGAAVFADHAFTAVKSVAEEKGQTDDPVLKPFVDGIEDVQIFPELISPYYASSGARDVYMKFMEQFMTGKKMDVDKELDKAAKESDELLKKAAK
ncbi:sugar ABC transporter substrate-binding protein [Bacillus sp. NEB1478]|uniref:ABC transporter substrate-binding protein n=1 Tax=Bacillus sp. NEB1478 TaxID=3073816 RepID=UPI0028730B6C|nr:sugar ABC transporter substrate-binding protein [Bacillus sp. NEB1478]WNB92551.1 sugar ABC transporter substrate-binding protein [Bacillus sp. NEB1478]